MVSKISLEKEFSLKVEALFIRSGKSEENSFKECQEISGTQDSFSNLKTVRKNSGFLFSIQMISLVPKRQRCTLPTQAKKTNQLQSAFRLFIM